MTHLIMHLSVLCALSGTPEFFDRFVHELETLNCKLEFEIKYGQLSLDVYKRIREQTLSSNAAGRATPLKEVQFTSTKNDLFRTGYWETANGVEHSVDRPDRKTLDEVKADATRQASEKGFFVTRFVSEREWIKSNDITVHAFGVENDPIVTARSKYSVEPQLSESPFDFDIGRFPFGIHGISRNSPENTWTTTPFAGDLVALRAQLGSVNETQSLVEILYRNKELGSPVYFRQIHKSANSDDCTVYEWFRLDGSRAPQGTLVVPTHSVEFSYKAASLDVAQLLTAQLVAPRRFQMAKQFLVTSCVFSCVKEIAFEHPKSRIYANGTSINIRKSGRPQHANYKLIKTLSRDALQKPWPLTKEGKKPPTIDELLGAKKQLVPANAADRDKFSQTLFMCCVIACVVLGCLGLLLWRFRRDNGK